MKFPELTPEETTELAEIAETNPIVYRRIMAQIAFIASEEQN
jgi:hypothetical protein